VTIHWPELWALLLLHCSWGQTPPAKRKEWSVSLLILTRCRMLNKTYVLHGHLGKCPKHVP
jgi:hypothetical protein